MFKFIKELFSDPELYSIEENNNILKRLYKEEIDRIEENKKRLKEMQIELDEILLTEPIFEIGTQVEYIKVPNGNVSFRVSMSEHSKLIYYPMSGNHASIYIINSKTTVQYFDANQIIHTITDESKWFKKV